MASEVGKLIISLGLDEKQFKNALKRSEDEARSFGTIVRETLISDISQKAFGALTNGVKNVGKSMVEVGMNFESSMSEVAAITGATGDDLALLEKTAKDFGSSTVFSASEAADALKYMGLAGWDAQQSSDALGGVLDLAAASGMELAAASDMVTDYLSAFGMEAEQSSYFADMLTYAQNNSNTTAAALGEAYKNCAANLNAAGQDVETTTSLLSMMANQGLKGSEAGTALNAVMRDMTAKMKNGAIEIGKTSVKVMDANGNYRDMTDILKDVENATNGMGEAEKAAALSSSFTADSIKGLNLIMNAGVDQAAAFEEELRKADGTAAATAETMNDNLAGKIKALQSKVEDLLIKGFEKMEPVLEGVIKALEWCADHADILIPILGTLAGVITTTFVATKVIEFGNKVKKVFDTTSKAAKKLSGGLSKTFKDGIGNQVATEAGESVEKVGKSIAEKITSLGSTLKTAFKTIGEVLSSVVGAVMEPLKAIFKGIGEAIAGFFLALSNPQLLVGVLVFTAAAAGIAAAILLIGGAIGIVTPGLSDFLNTVLIPLGAFLAGTLILLLNEVTDVIIRLTNEAIIPFGEFVRDTIVIVVNTLTDAIIRLTNEAIIPLINKVMEFLDWLLAKVSEVANGIKNTLGGIADWIKEHVIDPISNFFSRLWEGIKQGVEGVKTTISNIFSTIAGIIKTPINGIIGAINKVIETINGITVPDWVPGIGGAHANIPTIPTLAQGGYANNATAAIFGEAGKEVALPLERNTDNWSGLLAAALAEEFEMGEVAGTSGRSIENTQNIYINDKMDIRKVGNAFLQEVRRAA